MVSRHQEHINPRIHIHSQDRPHATQPCTMLKSAEREMHQPNTKGHYGIRSVFGGRVDCGRIHRHLGVVAAVSKLGRTPGDSAADGRRICRPIPHNRRWSDDRRQSDGRRRIDIRHRRTTHRPPRQAPRHRAYPDHSNVRHHITGAGQNRHAGLADESVAARHRHHAGHVLLRGADSPPRPARIAAATSERRFAGFAWHGDCLRVQPAAVRGVVDFPGRSRDPYFAFVGVVATLSLAGTLARQHATTAQQTAETEKAQSAQSTESTESARSQAKSPEPTQEKARKNCSSALW